MCLNGSPKYEADHCKQINAGINFVLFWHEITWGKGQTNPPQTLLVFVTIVTIVVIHTMQTVSSHIWSYLLSTKQMELKKKVFVELKN